MTTSPCTICHRDAGRDRYVCTGCTDHARKNLATIATLLPHADDKRARRHAVDYRNIHGTRTSETPLPYDPRVSRVVDPITTGLLGTCQIVWEGRGWHLHTHLGNGAAAATFLLDHVDWLATKPEGTEELQFLDTAASNLEQLFDRPPDTLYLGRCETTVGTDDQGEDVTCEQHVYVEATRPLRPWADCPRCHARIDVAERREEFAEAVDGYLATISEIVTLAPLLLENPPSRRTLHRWIGEGWLVPRGERVVRNTRGEWRRVETYRLGAVREAATLAAQARPRRARGPWHSRSATLSA